MMRRREILAGAALFGLPAATAADGGPLPDAALLERDPETYWKRIRDEQFLLPDWRAFMNNGSLGITPRPVLKAVTDYLSQSAALVNDDYPRWGYETLDEQRAELAEFAGCAKDELALTHNATEAMSVIANGIDLKAGVLDPVEHVSRKWVAWTAGRAHRDGDDGRAVRAGRQRQFRRPRPTPLDSYLAVLGPDVTGDRVVANGHLDGSPIATPVDSCIPGVIAGPPAGVIRPVVALEVRVHRVHIVVDGLDMLLAHPLFAVQGGEDHGLLQITQVRWLAS